MIRPISYVFNDDIRIRNQISSIIHLTRSRSVFPVAINVIQFVLYDRDDIAHVYAQEIAKPDNDPYWKPTRGTSAEAET